MKQKFMLVDNIKQEFWLVEDSKKNIIPFPSIGNG
jgi:hypothetical protein